MNPQLRQDYLKKQYEYLADKGYQIFSGNFSYGFTSHNWVSIKASTVVENIPDSTLVKSADNYAKLCEEKNAHIFKSQEDPILKDFFLNYFKSHTDKGADLLKFYKELTSQSLIEEYKELFPQIFDKKRLISAINQLTTKSFSFYRKEQIVDFKHFLEKSGLTREETKDVIYNYFYQRKSRLKDTAFSTFAKDSLLECFSDDTAYLEKFHSFMPFLKNAMIPNHDFDLFTDKNPYSVSFQLSYKKMIDNLSLDYCEDWHYKAIVNTFMKKYCEVNGIKEYHLIDNIKKPDILRVLAVHDNEEDLIKIQPQLVQLLKDLKAQKIELTNSRAIKPESLDAWFAPKAKLAI